MESTPPISDLLRILHLEDDPVDAELLHQRLRAAGFVLKVKLVASRDGFAEALADGDYDVILSDYTMPSYDGVTAMLLARKLRPEIPFIFVSGTIGEERAIEALKRGAADYVLKDNPARLVTAVRQALQQAGERRQRQAAEAKVREQAALLDRANDAIFISGLDGRIRYWNRGAERLYGWTAQEAVGRMEHELLGMQETGLIDFSRQELHSRGEWVGDLTKRAKDNRVLAVESRRSIVSDDQDRAQGVFIIETDVTERRRMEKQMLRTQRLEIIGELAGGVAHDLNNILSPVLMGSQLLAGQVSEGCRGILHTIESSAQRGVDMVRQLLSFARGGGEQRNGLVDVARLLDELNRFLTQTFSSIITIEAPPPSTELGRVKGNSTQIYQVLVNLCVNARDAMPEGGRLTVRSGMVDIDAAFFAGGKPGRPGHYVSLAVEDAGPGIPPDVLPRLFEAFFTTKSDGCGTGLGLSTSARIAEEHGGFIRVKSQEGVGSVFTLYLPVTSAAATGRGILVVDDDHAILEVVRAILATDGYDVVTADSGGKALELVQTYGDRLALVICDYRMPVQNGAETLQALRALKPDLICIGMSGYFDADTAHRMSMQAKTILPKPFTSKAILETVNRHLAACRN